MHMLTYITENSKSKSSIVSCILCILLVVLGGQEGSFHVEGSIRFCKYYIIKI